MMATGEMHAYRMVKPLSTGASGGEVTLPATSAPTCGRLRLLGEPVAGAGDGWKARSRFAKLVEMMMKHARNEVGAAV